MRTTRCGIARLAALARGEVVRRIAAVNDYRSGRTGPSGYEGWNMRIEREITMLAYQIADRADRDDRDNRDNRDNR